MRSDAEFDRFISEGLKEAADRSEVPALCKTEIDETGQLKNGRRQQQSVAC